jgi:hypothetical protein
MSREIIKRILNEQTDHRLSLDYLKKKDSGFPKYILDVIKKVYPENWGQIKDTLCETLPGFLDIYPVAEGQRWSILNFFDTNHRVIKKLLEEFHYHGKDYEKNYEGFKIWMDENKERLFGPGSRILEDMMRNNFETFKMGWHLEDKVVEIMNEKEGIDPDDVERYCIGSIRDRIDSIDFSINGVNFQVKPATYTKKVIDPIDPSYKFWMVATSGMKNYQRSRDLDYIVYSNGKDYVIFPNEDYSVTDGGKTVKHFKNPVTLIKPLLG